MKKLTTLIVSLLLVFSLLVSCGPSPEATEGEKEQTTEPAKAAEGDDATAAETTSDNFNAEGLPIVNEPVTIRVWGAESVGNEYETNLSTLKYEEMTGVHVEWDLFSASVDGDQAFNLMLASEDYPDYIASWFSTERIRMTVEGGVAHPLNDLIEQYGENYRAVLEAEPEYKDLLTADDGNIYTFMYTDTGVHKATEYKMWVYTEWLENLDMEPPTTPEEFKEMLIAFTTQDPNGNGEMDELPLVGYHGGRQSNPLNYLMNPFQLYNDNYHYITDDGKVEFVANTDGWREGLQYLNDLYESGLIMEETYVQDHSQCAALINRPAGDTIVGAFPFWFQGAIIDSAVLDWTDYQAIAPLKGPSGLQQSAARIGGHFTANGMITTQAENPEIVFRWIDYMLSDDGLIMGHFGPEGEAWEYVDEPDYQGNSPSIKVLVQDPPPTWNSGFFPRYDKEEVRYGTTDNPEQRNIDNTYVLFSAAEIYEPYYVNRNIPDVVWNDDADVENARTDYLTLFNEYISMASTEFVIGNTDINDDAQWQSYLDELEAMGLTEYIDTLTAYYGLNG